MEADVEYLGEATINIGDKEYVTKIKMFTSNCSVQFQSMGGNKSAFQMQQNESNAE